MCGRFVSATPPAELATYFGATPPTEDLLPPSYNVAPTNDVFAVFEDGRVRRMDTFHWGLVPWWARDPKIGSRMINARAEGLAEKNAFKAPFRRKRCLVPADGFFEWKKVPGEKKKQPVYIHRADGAPLAFAGLWEVWRDPEREDEVLHSCTIITTTANDEVAEIHDRMPVILGEDTWDTWLDQENQDTDALGRLLVPAPPTLLEIYPVSTDVNKVANQGPDLIARVDPATGEVHGQLSMLDGDTPGAARGATREARGSSSSPSAPGRSLL